MVGDFVLNCSRQICARLLSSEMLEAKRGNYITFFANLNSGMSLGAKSAVCNLRQSSSSLTIFVSLWVIIISSLFFYLSKLIYSGFLQLKSQYDQILDSHFFLHFRTQLVFPRYVGKFQSFTNIRSNGFWTFISDHYFSFFQVLVILGENDLNS